MRLVRVIVIAGLIGLPFNIYPKVCKRPPVMSSISWSELFLHMCMRQRSLQGNELDGFLSSIWFACFLDDNRLFCCDLLIYKPFRIKWKKNIEKLVHYIRKLTKIFFNLTELTLNINNSGRSPNTLLNQFTNFIKHNLIIFYVTIKIIYTLTLILNFFVKVTIWRIWLISIICFLSY